MPLRVIGKAHKTPLGLPLGFLFTGWSILVLCKRILLGVYMSHTHTLRSCSDPFSVWGSRMGLDGEKYLCLIRRLVVLVLQQLLCYPFQQQEKSRVG